MAWRRHRNIGSPQRDGPVRIRDGLRLSPNEERYVLAETLTGQVYAVPSGARFKGPVDFDKLRSALQETCDRHEARRTGYERQPDGRFTKYIHDRATVHIERVAMPGASDAEIIEAVNSHVLRRGDLSPAELHRYIFIELGPEDVVFAFGLHHATSDGVSFGAFVAETYARLLDFPPPEAGGQYSDFWDHDWAASDAYRQAEAFWHARLDGVGDPGAWPEDRARERSQARQSEGVELSPEAVARTEAAAKAIGVSHFTFFYAVYLVLLSRMIGSPTVVTTFQSAGRRAFPGAERALGVFSNALINATPVDPAQSIAALARRLKGEVKDAVAHELYPYHHVIRSTGVRARYAINWMPEMGPVTFDDIQIVPMLLNQNQDDDDLNLRFSTYMGQVRLYLYYDPSAYEPDRVRAAAELLAKLADAFAADIDAPIGRTGSAPFAAPGLLPDLDAPLPGGGDARIFDAFLAQARAKPDAVAVEAPDGACTYGALAARSAAVAEALQASGVGRGERVAIVAERGAGLIAAILGAARAGAVFAVLDPAHPEHRLRAFLGVAAPQAIVHAGGTSVSALARRLAADSRTAVLDADAAAPARSHEGTLDGARPADPAYILFTSGTTGQPKAVACSHRPLAHFVGWQAQTFGLGADDRVTLLSGLGHDPLLRDIFTPLSVGATVCAPPSDVLATPVRLARWVREARATAAHITPQLGRLLAAGAAAAGGLPDLRHVFWGGDRLHRDEVAALAAQAANARQTSFYGATETPQAVSFADVDAGMVRDHATLGAPVEGFQLAVLDRDGQQMGVGEVGEIAVRSNWLSLGYVEAGRLRPHGRPDLYRTGDRGLRLPDGRILFVGRLDDQLKIRGHRVEPAEVAAVLRARPDIDDAWVLPVGEGDGLGLAAFVVGRERHATEADVRDALTSRLPAHMVPREIVWLDRAPLLPNGKVDRAALYARLEARAAQAATPPDPPSGPAEARLCESWSALFGGAAVGRHATFAGLGGDSLSYVQGYLALQEVVGEPPERWPQMTVAELAALAPPAPTRATAAVDAPILVRAAAIVLVVGLHFGTLPFAAGATTGLMLVSGAMLGRLTLPEVFARRSIAPMLRVLWNLFVPTFLLGAAIFLARIPGDQPTQPYILLMTADLQDHTSQAPRTQEGYLWFVHALLHIQLAIAAVLFALQAARRGDVSPRALLLGLFIVGCVAKFGTPILLSGSVDPRALDPLATYFLPWVQFPTFVLGAMIAMAVSREERRTLAIVLVAYSAATGLYYGPAIAAFALASGLMLLFLPQVKLPRVVAPVVIGLAGASLWIYLTHVLVRDGLFRLGVPFVNWLAVGFALAVGVGAWRVSRWAGQRWRAPLARLRTPWARTRSEPAG